MPRPVLSRLAPTTLTLASILMAGPIIARDNSPLPKELPPVFEAVVNCRALTADSERLACYDRSVTALAEARDKQDIVVADRATIRETKKGLFGFALPKLKLFGGTEGDEVNEIETTISGVRDAADGHAIFTLTDGARWKQTEGGFTFAKPGASIRIKRGALGGFFASVNKGAAVRVMRLPQ